MRTSFDFTKPIATVSGRSNKKRAPIPQPRLLKNHKNSVGGVDQHDWLLEKHSIAIKAKKWYWCLVTRIIDMAVVNACLIYKTIHEKKTTSIKDFRRVILFKTWTWSTRFVREVFKFTVYIKSRSSRWRKAWPEETFSRETSTTTSISIIVRVDL